MSDPVRAATEAAARTAYGRLLSFLASRSRDLAAAEDALSEAFRIALETWPRDGVPARPEAWLLTVARRRMANDVRHDRVRGTAADTVRLLSEEAASRLADDTFPDERLKLLFICAHPSIDAAVRTPLMLQAVLGLDAGRIASAFLVAPATMSQRLVRAKTKIRDAGIAFAAPAREVLPDRLEAVLEAVYGAFGAGWEALGADAASSDLAGEAIFLARLLADLLPSEPEARGLAALVLHCEARRPARRDPAGRYVPLSAQDPALWSAALIATAEEHLLAAASHRRPGRFQLEAAIQSAHAERRTGRPIPWPAIKTLYDRLIAQAPTVGARVARAVAVGEVLGPPEGLAALNEVAPDAVGYQPYWAARAHLEASLGCVSAAGRSYRRAVELCRDPAISSFLVERLVSLRSEIR